MATVKTEKFEAFSRIKYQVRVTAKKMFIDRVSSRSTLVDNFIYIEYVLVHPHRNEWHYVATKPYSSWTQKSETLEGIIKIVEAYLDMDIPQDAVDIYASRLMAKVMTNG